MQTNFSAEQLRNPELREANRILRACVHCGFCLATCPTYAILGDELDSPRGRIYLIKDMLENDRPASAEVALHIDRCLSCLACMTTCPSGVNYMHLVDLARDRIERSFRRPLFERALRGLLAFVLPREAVFRAALRLARLARPAARLLPARLRAALELVPPAPPPPSPFDRRQRFAAQGTRTMRAALLAGCVQKTLAPEINAATVRLLTRHGVEVVVPEAAGCCGALVHHMGRAEEARASARANVAAWSELVEREGLDAVIANASGCGTMLKDYGFLLRGEPALADKAARISELACDIAEFVRETGLRLARPGPAGRRLVVAYQSPCSLHHGQGLHELPMQLLESAGFEVREVPDGHLCCGSAGTYNLLQPELASELGRRKAAAIESIAPDAVAAGNIGCIVQIARYLARPVVHPVELLDWATGGPIPPALARAAVSRT